MKYEKLKYKDDLKRYANCPPEDFSEEDRLAYRWVHAQIEKNDFMPLNVIKEPPQRLLDHEDKMCMGYGLSVYDTFDNSIRSYQKIHKGLRNHQRIQFKKDKGTCIAEVELNKKDGVCNIPDPGSGHFTFHEYEDCKLTHSILKIKEIFDEDGNFKISQRT